MEYSKPVRVLVVDPGCPDCQGCGVKLEADPNNFSWGKKICKCVRATEIEALRKTTYHTQTHGGRTVHTTTRIDSLPIHEKQTEEDRDDEIETDHNTPVK